MPEEARLDQASDIQHELSGRQKKAPSVALMSLTGRNDREVLAWRGSRPCDDALAFGVRIVDELGHLLGGLGGDVAPVAYSRKPLLEHLDTGPVDLPGNRQARAAKQLIDEEGRRAHSIKGREQNDVGGLLGRPDARRTRL